MNDNSIAVQQVKQLKQKLESSISARKSLENEFDSYTEIFNRFVGKLSSVNKGMDQELDNRLAKLHKLVKGNSALDKLSAIVKDASKTLDNVSEKNSSLISKTHKQVLHSISQLQKIKGLPDQLRRDLRVLLQRTETPPSNTVYFIPVLLELVTLHLTTVKSQSSGKSANNKGYNAFQQNDDANKNNENDVTNDGATGIDGDVFEKFYRLLSDIVLSDKQTAKLDKIRKSLRPDISSTHFINTIIDTFELVVADLRSERETAENFLSNLNDALSSVEQAVKNTLDVTCDSEKSHEKIDVQLKQHISSMSSAVEQATSLDQLKVDINSKLSFIVGSIDQKSELEEKQRKALQKFWHFILFSSKPSFLHSFQ